MNLASSSFTLSLWSLASVLLLAVGVDANMWRRKCKTTNWIPGKCDVTGDEDPETFDCCDNTCSSCSKKDPFVTWERCKYDAAAKLTCGKVKKKGEPYVCDFEACPPNSKWHMEGKKYQKWQKWIGKCDMCVYTNMPEIFNNYADFDQCMGDSEEIPGFSDKFWKKACKAAKKGCKGAPVGSKFDKMYLKKACTKAKQCPKNSKNYWE
eukprot:CAMPEP_0170998188 /NCGR_PEP_ID=MMETSP0736-20130129/13316_1 /TAXON_ID=186038 /ORGANISM="Fragilariopsis kerguelensis, Strain L26-C5" /LENGTH=207 /DNA_ID=CAMNT_0011425041 /DNA_START=191 /DNA_END=814 /DNA_ORIENTATION=+